MCILTNLQFRWVLCKKEWWNRKGAERTSTGKGARSLTTSPHDYFWCAIIYQLQNENSFIAAFLLRSIDMKTVWSFSTRFSYFLTDDPTLRRGKAFSFCCLPRIWGRLKRLRCKCIISFFQKIEIKFSIAKREKSWSLQGIRKNSREMKSWWGLHESVNTRVIHLIFNFPQELAMLQFWFSLIPRFLPQKGKQKNAPVKQGAGK